MALSMLSTEQLQAATAILPILNQLKSGPFASARNAMIQYPVPTVEEAVRHIKNSPLGLNEKSTVISSLRVGLETLQGEALFLPASSGKTEVEILEDEIEALEMKIASM